MVLQIQSLAFMLLLIMSISSIIVSESAENTGDTNVRTLDWISIKGIEPDLNGVGHYWIEIYDKDGKLIESYGWFPTSLETGLNLPFEREVLSIAGVPGVLNAGFDQDPVAIHAAKGEASADWGYHPVLTNTLTDEQVLDKIHNFVNNYKGDWEIVFRSCHTFQQELMNNIGLVEPVAPDGMVLDPQHEQKMDDSPDHSRVDHATITQDSNQAEQSDFLPKVEHFSVTPPFTRSIGESFEINCIVSDNGELDLKQVELWRTQEKDKWPKDSIQTKTLPGEIGPFFGSFTDSPTAPGKYWYGVHVVDNAGNWNDERNSNTNGQPRSFEPVEVEVVSSTLPIVQAFQVTPQSLNLGESITIDYTVSDSDGSGLKQVELWRKDESSDWQQVSTNPLAGETGSVSGKFTDSPTAPGRYWYGVHVVDNAGNWNDEGNSNTDGQPSSFEPMEVNVSQEVTLNLYVHDGSADGPVLSEVEVTGQDASGKSFSRATDANGLVVIIGLPGSWQFSANKFGYAGNSWWQKITETCIKHAFLFEKDATQENVTSVSLICTLAGHSGAVHDVAFSPDGRTLASGSSDDTVKLWDVSNGTEVATLAGHSSDVEGVDFSPDGRILASGCIDTTVKLWDVPSRTEVATLASGAYSTVLCVNFSPDGRILASGSGSMDNTVKLWDVPSRTEVTTLAGHSSCVYCVAFSPDGRTLASGSNDNTIKLWDVSSGTEVATLAGHSNYVRSIAFSPDGRTLASGSSDNTVKLWDVSSRTEVAALAGHTDWVLSVAFSPDGRTLASGSSDNTVKLWDVSSRTEVATLAGHSDGVWSVAFSPDGRTLASGSSDKTVKLWDVA